MCGGEDVTAVLVVPLQLSNVTEETTELEGMLQQLLETKLRIYNVAKYIV